MHVVRDTDTLWKISEQYLADAYLWPQLWESNKHIVNPHWIYPNDQILIRPVRRIAEVEPPPAPAETLPAPPSEPPPPASPPATPPPVRAPNPAEVTQVVDRELPQAKPMSIVKAGDLYCSGFIRVERIEAAGKVVAKFRADGGAFAAATDYVYLDHGTAAGVQVGNMFTVIRATRTVESPRPDTKGLGTHYLEISQIRVVMSQPMFALAWVAHSCDAIELGDSLIRFEELRFPGLPAPREISPFVPATGKLTGMVAITKNALMNSGSEFKGSSIIPGQRSGHLTAFQKGLVGDGDTVYIDVGRLDGVNVGDIVLIRRPLRLKGDLFELPGKVPALREARYVIGELVVLKVEERASTALVTYASDAIVAGDHVEMR